MTPNQMIADALSLIGCNPIGQTIRGYEVSECYRVFNRMLDEMALEKLIQRWEGSTSFVTAQGVAVVTLESGSDATDVGVSSIGLTSDDSSWSLDLAERDDYLAIPDKTTQGRPKTYTPIVANRVLTVTLWPVPDGVYQGTANIQHGLYFADLNDDVTLPVGYESLLVTNLAVKLAPLYEREAPVSVIADARSSKMLVKRMNWQGLTVVNEMIGVVR